MRAVARQTLSRGAVELLLLIAGVSLLLFLDSGRASADTAPGGPPATPVPSATAGSQLTVNRASSTATSTSSDTSSVKRVSTGSTASTPTPSTPTPSAPTPSAPTPSAPAPSTPAPSTPAPSTPTPATAAHRAATPAAMTSVTAPAAAAPAASTLKKVAASGSVGARPSAEAAPPIRPVPTSSALATATGTGSASPAAAVSTRLTQTAGRLSSERPPATPASSGASMADDAPRSLPSPASTASPTRTASDASPSFATAPRHSDDRRPEPGDPETSPPALLSAVSSQQTGPRSPSSAAQTALAVLGGLLITGPRFTGRVRGTAIHWPVQHVLLARDHPG